MKSEAGSTGEQTRRLRGGGLEGEAVGRAELLPKTLGARGGQPARCLLRYRTPLPVPAECAW